jgi:hypothetical protein
MPKLQATRELRYAGKTLQPGDIFDASEKDAKVLKQIKKAADAPVVPRATQKPPKVEKVATPEVLPDPVTPPAVVDAATEAETKESDPAPTGYGRQGYRRRDLRSED